VLVKDDEVWEATGGLEEVWAFVIAAQDANDVQERQLQLAQVSEVDVGIVRAQYLRFAILSQDDAFGEFLGQLSACRSCFRA
jgi:hypothetical protein